MRLGKFVKAPAEVKRYTVDYTNWLDTGETVTAKAFEVTPSGALTIASSVILTGAQKISFFVAGGNNDETYRVAIRATTSAGQVKEDVLQFSVKTA